MQKSEDDRRVPRFVDTCRQHQLKITPPRVAIYKALVQSDQHPTADKMFQTVRADYPNISFDRVISKRVVLKGLCASCALER